MPPIRIQSLLKSANQEGRILLALSDIKNGRIALLRAAARLYNISESTLRSRAKDILLRVDIRPNGYKLIQLEEDLLTEWILSIDSCGAVSRSSTVKEMANILLAVRRFQSQSTVDINWATTFIKCRNKFCIYFSKYYNYQYTLNKDPKLLREWFTNIQYIIDKNGIQPENIYNFDKTEFAIDFISI